MHTLYKTFKHLELLFYFAYVRAFWLGIANIPSALTTNVFDNNIQYLLQFGAAVVITNCAWLLFD